MRRLALVMVAACALAGCIEGSTLDQVRAGMSKDQVMAIMGKPEGYAEKGGRDCAAYSVMKDFWRRTPWEVSERYYICYNDNKVEMFGRADQPDFR